MESLFLLLLIVIIVLLLTRSNRHSEELLHRLLEQTRYLTEEVRELRRRQDASPLQKEAAPTPKPEPPRTFAPRIIEKEEQPAPPGEAPRPYEEPIPRWSAALPEPLPATGASVPEAVEPPAPKEPLIERFFREHPDLEKFIGENLVNKIGIAILVLGIGFFVKYAIDQDWIGEAGRVAIGFACGALLAGIAHYLRRSYRAFSSVLAGGGIAVFYTTIAFAFHQYQLFSQAKAFGLLVAITIFAVALALLYDSLALAIIATVGGFITPFLVSNGSGNYVVLLSYLIVLNGGILALAFFRRWPALNALAFFFTGLIVGGWIYTALEGAAPPPSDKLVAFWLISALYGIFLGANMAFPVRFGRPFRPFDLSLLLLLTGAYYAAGMLLLGQVQAGRYQGVFTIASGALDLALAIYCFRRRGTDRNLLYVLIGLALTFITLAVPVQLEGHAITLFWSAEFVLLYWLFLRSGIRIFRYGAYALMALALISLGMDWLATENTDGGLTVLFDNVSGAVTNIVAMAAFAALNVLLRRENTAGDDPQSASYFRHRMLVWTSGGLAVVLLYASALTAVNLYFYKVPGVAVPNVYHRIITAALALGLGLLLQKRRVPGAPWLQLALLAGALIYYLGSQEAIEALRAGIAAGRFSWAHFGGHGIASLLYLLLFAQCIRVAARSEDLAAWRTALAWVLSGAVLLFLSIDGGHFYAMSGGAAAMARREAQWGRAALTILWGLCSFALMWLGMRRGARMLRIISLSIFLLALLKLFFYDLHDVSEGGKIAAFILLGALLLTVSFMYQKLKKILIDDRAEK
jgi:uncharacterized membrane protein